MSINSSDLQILVARTSDTQKVSTQRERAGQEITVMAGMSEKVARERSQQRVVSTPKAERGRVDKEGHNPNTHEDGKPDSGEKGSKKKTPKAQKDSGHLLDITI